MRAWAPSLLTFSIVTCWALLACAPSAQPLPSDPDAEPTFPAVSCPHAGNRVWFGVSLAEAPETRAAFLHRIDAWLQAYPAPGTRLYVFRYTRSPHSYRVPELGLVRLGWWLDGGAPVVGDLAWEIPHWFYGLDDPPPLGHGPATLPPDDRERRARALTLAAQ